MSFLPPPPPPRILKHNYLLDFQLSFSRICQYESIRTRIYKTCNIKILVKDTVMGCGGRPNHQQHYVKRVSAATTFLDNNMTYFYYLIYSTTLHRSTLTQILNIGPWKKLVHQSIVHKLLPKNYHEESLITSHCRINIYFYSSNQFGIRTYEAPK